MHFERGGSQIWGGERERPRERESKSVGVSERERVHKVERASKRQMERKRAATDGGRTSERARARETSSLAPVRARKGRPRTFSAIKSTLYSAADAAKRPSTMLRSAQVSKETYIDSKRDLLYTQKRPPPKYSGISEVRTSVKRDLHIWKKRHA